MTLLPTIDLATKPFRICHHKVTFARGKRGPT